MKVGGWRFDELAATQQNAAKTTALTNHRPGSRPATAFVDFLRFEVQGISISSTIPLERRLGVICQQNYIPSKESQWQTYKSHRFQLRYTIQPQLDSISFPLLTLSLPLSFLFLIREALPRRYSINKAEQHWEMCINILEF